MDILTIKNRFDLLKTATLQRAILIKDIAKELKESTTDLMQFVLDNPKLFATEEVWSYKNKPHYYYICGRKCKETISVKDKLKGLGIAEVYLSAEDNFRTDEWLEKQIRLYSKTIWLSKWDNYGTIEGEYVSEDTEEGGRKFKYWRNTPEKIAELKELGVLYTTTFFYGGFGDCSPHECNTAINKTGKEIAEKEGWTIIS